MKSLLLIFFVFISTAHSAEKEFADTEIIHLLQDRPNYLLLGKPETKGQLSFKFKIFKKTNIYVAYTQKFFWDLFEHSSPFRDLNYNPAFFYRFRLGSDKNSLFDVIAYEHESNGKGGAQSRSWDRSGVRYQTVQHFENGMKAEWSVRGWIPYRQESTNRDLSKYRGVFELNFTLSQFLGPYFELGDLALRIYPAGKYYINPLQGGQELTFRMKGKVGFLMNAVFQVFQGYGENMLEYNQRVLGLRAGIGI